MSTELNDLLFKTRSDNHLAVYGVFGTNEVKAREFIFKHSVALNELKNYLELRPSAVYLGSKKHLDALKDGDISSNTFKSLPDKAFFSETKNLAVSLFDEASKRISREELKDIEDALEIENELYLYGDPTRKILKTLKETPEGIAARSVSLGAYDGDSETGTNIAGGLGCVITLILGVVGFVLLGLLGIIIFGVVGLVIMGAMSALFSNPAKDSVKKIQKDFRDTIPFLQRLGLNPMEVFRSPELGLSRIEAFATQAGETIYNSGKLK